MSTAVGFWLNIAILCGWSGIVMLQGFSLIGAAFILAAALLAVWYAYQAYQEEGDDQ